MTPDDARRKLKGAAWLHRPETQAVFELLDGGIGKTRAVGGIVRDTLLERVRDSGEIDFATALLPEVVMRRAGEAGIAAYPTGIEHGTVTLRLGDLVAEVTTMRQDVETDGRRAKVKFGTNLGRDAERRDFTMNALYAGMDGELLDPLGVVEDCLRGIVRFIGDPDRRIAEDRLRVYRFFRFSASHGDERLDPAGLAAVVRAAGTLGELSAERVGAEMKRMLALPKVGQTLGAMRQSAILDIPATAVEALATYERHVRRATLAARLALLVAQLGSTGLKQRWRLSNDEVDIAEAILAAARLLIDFRINEAAYRYPASLADAVDVAAVLAGWTEAGRSAVVQRLEAIEVPKFPLSGGDLIARGMAPGPRLGAELTRLENKWISSDFRLDRAALLEDFHP